jgi:hypothetical protein
MWFVIAVTALIGGTWLIVIAGDTAGFAGGIIMGVLGLAALRRGFRS